MTDPHDPARLAADAAARIAADWKLGVTPSARVLHATAWILARAGRPVPEPPDPVSADLVATTAAAATGDLRAVRARAARAFARSTADGATVLQGVAALGPAFAELVLDLAIAYPEAQIGGTNVAAGLGRVGSPRGGDWLRHLRAAPSPLPLLEATIELVLAGRDLGAPDAIAEATWAELETTALVGSPTWWDGRLRMLSRTSPEDAAFELLDATALVGRKAITNGHLVLGRWACGDRAAATSFVQTYAPRMRAWGRWTRGLAHDGVLDDAARAGWSDALAAASDPWDAGQLLALAVRLGDRSAVEEVLGRATLSDLERLSYPERSLRLLRLQSPERADATRRTLDAHLPEGLRPGELHDWLTVLTDDRFDLPWWIAYLPGLP